jgi:hypothetical protein
MDMCDFRLNFREGKNNPKRQDACDAVAPTKPGAFRPVDRAQTSVINRISMRQAWDYATDGPR